MFQNHPKESRCVNAPKVMSLRKREQDTIDGKNALAEEYGKSKVQEAISTMLGYPSRKITTTEQQKNVNVSTIVTRRVSKKLQNNRVDLKLSFECSDKPLSNVYPGGKAHHQNEDGEDDCLKSPGSRLQNTNISIRTDLYDSSHNLKHRVKKQGTIAIHTGGVFKPRVLGIPRRELHFAGVDSSPHSSRTITSVKMERMRSLDSSKKPDLGGNNNEKDKTQELIPRMMMKIDSRTASSHSQEHSYASPSAESRLCDNGVEENCRNTVNTAINESRNSLNLYQENRWGEKNAQICERNLESDLRKNSNHLQPIEYFDEKNRPLSESPPFRGFEPATESGFGELWAQSALISNSLTMENMLDIITVDKTSPIAKMLIGSVIGFPSMDSVRIFQDSRSCGKNQEPVSKVCKEPEISIQKIKAQDKTEVESSGQKKWLSNIRTRSYVDLGKRVTARSADQGETSASSSTESFKFVGKAISNRNSRKSRESKRLEDKEGENIVEIAYAEEETQLSQELVDSSYNHTRCSTPSDKLDSNFNPAKVQRSRSRSLRKNSDATSNPDIKTRRTPIERNRNSLVIKQYSNRRRVRAAEISSEVMSQKSISESHEEKEETSKDGDGVSTRVHPGPRCDEPIDEGSGLVDTVDCSIENLVESKAAGKILGTKDAKKTNNVPAECNLKPRTTSNSCLRRPSLTETSKLNNNVCDKLSANNNTIEKRTPEVSESLKKDANSIAEVFSDPVSCTKVSVSDSVSEKKSSEQIRLVKRSRVRRKRKIEIANLVIDMNMSPRCQISKSERSQRSGNYLRRRGSTTILDQSRKRRNVDPVKHPTSPLKRLKKNVQLRSSPAKVVKVSTKKVLPLQKRSGNRGNSSKNNDVINIRKNNKSVKRMIRTDNKVTNKKLIEPKKTNMNSAKKPAEIPKIRRKQDSVAIRMKKTDQEKPIQHSKRDVTARTRSGRVLRGVAIGRLGLRRALLPGLETFVRKKKKQRNDTETDKEKDSLENPGRQSLPQREFTNNSTLTCNYCKLPVNTRKPTMVSVMTQCSLISEPPQQQFESVASIDAAINVESGLHAANGEYLTASDSGSECICSSSKPTPKVVKNETNNYIETKLESAFDLDIVSRDIEDNESEENGRPVFRRALDRVERHEKSEELFARSDIELSDRSKRLTPCGQSESDSVAKRGFIRYVRSRRKQSAFVPVKSVERNFRIAQLKSIGFKPIKPEIFPPHASEEESECERRRTSDSPRIVYSSGVVKRGVHEEYDKYTSEENNVVQYMDSELCYEDIENEDNVSSSDYYNEERFGDSVFTQKLEFVKLGSEAEEDDSNDDLEPLEEREEDEEEFEFELEQDEEDVEEEEEEAIEEEEEEEEDEEEEEEEVVEVEVEEFKTEDYKTAWEAHLERKSSSCENTEQTVVDSDGDVPWHGWRKIISNEETYFVGW